MAGVTGLEPATSAVTGQRSNQLSYTPLYAFKGKDCCLMGFRHDVKPIYHSSSAALWAFVVDAMTTPTFPENTLLF